MNEFWQAIGALIPPIGVGLIFWFAIRSLIRADAKERIAMRKYEMEQDALAAKAAEESTPQNPA